MDRCYGDILPSASISASDALNSGSLISSNVIEAASELREISSLLPDFEDAIGVVISLSGGRKIETLAGLARVTSGLLLYKSFGLDPNVQLVNEVSTALLKAGKYFSNEPGSMVKKHGKFRHVFPAGTFGRDESTLVTRTLVEYPSDSSDLSQSLLNWASVGVSPLPHSWWDLVPLSFVVDWFARVGPKLEVAGNALIGTTIKDLRLVHSFTVDSPLTEYEMDSISSQALDYGGPVDVPKIRWYRREVSRWFPVPRSSSFGFLDAGNPPWVLAISLATQLLV